MSKFIALLLCLASGIALGKPAVGGKKNVPFTVYGTADSATTGAADLVFTVKGLQASHVCVVTAKAFGTGPVAVRGPAVAAVDTLTVTVDANQTAGTTTVAYLCFVP